jgi:hypothetical protein
MEITMNPQETQPELVEIENYRIPVESRTLPAAYMDGHLPMQIRPWKILYKKTYKHYESAIGMENDEEDISSEVPVDAFAEIITTKIVLLKFGFFIILL